MLKYIGRWLLMMIPFMLGVILIVFTLMYITPGDPVDTRQELHHLQEVYPQGHRE